MQRGTNEMAVPVAEVVAGALRTPVERLPPLSEAINLDALDAIVTADPSHDVTVRFSYAGLRVLVHSGGTVYARPIPDGSREDPVGDR